MILFRLKLFLIALGRHRRSSFPLEHLDVHIIGAIAGSALFLKDCQLTIGGETMQFATP